MTVPTIDVDGDGAADGLLALVVAVVEILVEAMEREGVRRMEAGDLTDEQVERLGQRFAAIEAELSVVRETAEIGDEVDDLRGQLDGLVGDAIHAVDTTESHPHGDLHAAVADQAAPGRRGDDD